MSSTYLVFPDEATCNSVMAEICATPNIEEGIGPVWVWYPPNADAEANVVAYALGADGRCMVAHHWAEVEVDWLRAQLAAWPTVEVLDAPPADWEWPEPPTP